MIVERYSNALLPSIAIEWENFLTFREKSKVRFSTNLHAEATTIDIITHKEVLCCRGVTTNFEKFHQIVELAMDISTD